MSEPKKKESTRDFIIDFLSHKSQPTSASDIVHAYEAVLNKGDLASLKSLPKAIGISLFWMRKSGIVVESSPGMWSLTERGRADQSLLEGEPQVNIDIQQFPLLDVTLAAGQRRDLSALQLAREPFRVVFIISPVEINKAVALYECLGEDEDSLVEIELPPDDTIISLGPDAPNWTPNQTTSKNSQRFIVIFEDGSSRTIKVPSGSVVTKAYIDEVDKWF